MNVGDMPVEKKEEKKEVFRAENKTERFKIVDNLSNLSVHFHWLNWMIAMSWIDD